ncbi:NAD(P)-binding protein [Myxococcota bacterium]|nr:NAD(P)-binding protein [Myxococcota bacterium]
MKYHYEFVIIGGGLSGLSAAFFLQLKGRKTLVIEQHQDVGGHARTEYSQGGMFDWTGHWLHLKDGPVKEMIQVEFPGQFMEISRNAVIFMDGNYIPYPFQAHTAYCGFEEADKIRDSYRNRPNPGSKTFKDLLISAFGHEMYRVFFEPYNFKIWGADPEILAGKLTAGYVPVPVDSEVIEGSKSHRILQTGYNQTFLYPISGGIGSLGKNISKKLNADTLRTNLKVIKVEPHNHLVYTAAGDSFSYDILINTSFLPDFVDLTEGFPGRPDFSYRNLIFADVLKRKKKYEKPFHWAYIPDISCPVYRLGKYSDAVPYLGSEDLHSCYVEFAPCASEMTKDELQESTSELMIKMELIDSPEDISYFRLRSIRGAYPHFTTAYPQSIETTRSFYEQNSIYLLGRFGSFIYSSMGSDMENARILAEKLG